MPDLGVIRFGQLLAEPPEYGANASALPFNGVDPRYLRITDIDDTGRLLHDDVRSIPRTLAAPYLLSQGDIVIARTGNTVGKSYLHDDSNGALAFAGYLVRFRLDKDKADPKFVFHFLHSPDYWSWIGNTLRTGAQPNVNAAEYKQLPLPAFSPPEQRKIARILTTSDNLIEKTEALIAKYLAIKQGMMHDLFTRGVDEHGHLRPSYAEAPDLYHQTPLGWIPKQWEAVRLGDHTTVKARLGWKGLKSEEYVDDGYIFLATPNLKANQIDFENVNYISKWRYDESPEIQLRVGDVLIVKDGSTLGISNYVRYLPRPTTVNGSIAVVRTEPTLFHEFLYHFVNGHAFQKLITLKKAGLGVPHLFQADLREFAISLPPLPEQQKIADLLTRADSGIEDNQLSLEKYKALKAGLMQDLLTGKVRVQVDKSDEVAAHV